MALTPCVRAGLFLFVMVPRTVIATYLLTLGFRWLSASTSFADMILNSLSLGFVVQIDELLFTSIAPVISRREISETKFFFKEDDKSVQDVDRAELHGVVRTMAWVVLVLASTFMYALYFQSVLPGDLNDLRTTCGHYLRAERFPFCNMMAFSSAAIQNAECYPYGGKN